MVVIALLVLSVSVAAGDFELVGGPTLSKVEFTYTDSYSGIAPAGDVDFKVEYDAVKKIETGATGYFAGLRYIMDNDLGFGIGYESLSAKFRDDEHVLKNDGEIIHDYYDDYFTNKGIDNNTVEHTFSGPYLEMLYKINNMFSVRGSVISTSYQVDYDYYIDKEEEFNGSTEITKKSGSKTIMEGSGLGYQIGAELNYPLTENLSILSSANYITTELEIKRKYDDDQEKLVPYDQYVKNKQGLTSIDTAEGTLEYSGYKFTLGLNYSF